MRTAFMVLCLLVAGTAVAQAAGGDLDTSYGTGGVAIADFGQNAFGNALLVQGDGKVVIAGTGTSLFGTTTDVVTARFGTDGKLDPTYGQGTGESRPDFGHNETGYGAALQPDGKIVVAGDIDGPGGTSDVLMTRFNADGSLDNLFGQAGKAQVNVIGPDFIRALTLLPDGRIDVAGYVYTNMHSYGIVAQLNNPTGTLDTTFALGGVFDGEVFEQTLTGIALTPAGAVRTVGNNAPSIGSSHDFAYDNLNHGLEQTDYQDLGGDDLGEAVVVQPDGKALLVGSSNAAGTFDFAVMRLNADGSVDKSFGSAGREFIDLGGSDTAQAVALQPDGKILLAGTTSKPGSSSQIGVVRLEPNGQLDSTFGASGIAIPSLASAGALQATGVGLQSDGKIVVGGTITPTGSSRKDLLVVRLQGDASATGGAGNGGGNGGSSGGGGGGGGGGLGGGPVPVCQGHKATIVGTGAADHLTGTKHADVIVGLGGNDTINGLGGNDIVCAGAGNDTVSGGAGNDLIDGQDGADVLTGGDGKDTLDGGNGNDKLSGGAGSDQLFGRGGKDILNGQAGSDHLAGGPGDDQLKGGAGTDQLSGGAGTNRDSQ